MYARERRERGRAVALLREGGGEGRGGGCNKASWLEGRRQPAKGGGVSTKGCAKGGGVGKGKRERERRDAQERAPFAGLSRAPWPCPSAHWQRPPPVLPGPAPSAHWQCPPPLVFAPPGPPPAPLVCAHLRAGNAPPPSSAHPSA